jgi:hypothetical protein
MNGHADRLNVQSHCEGSLHIKEFPSVTNGDAQTTQGLLTFNLRLRKELFKVERSALILILDRSGSMWIGEELSRIDIARELGIRVASAYFE